MEKKYQKVAIIMRTKDRALFLKRAINSVIRQRYKEWILIIINDGGSTEDLKKVLDLYKEYDEKILIINNEQSSGMEAASNKGIIFVDSDYIVIHDDDDTWEQDFLYRTVGYLEQNLECKGVITHSNKVIEDVIADEIKIKKSSLFNGRLKGMIDLYELCIKNLFPPISFIYRRTVTSEIGLYDESLPVLGDWEFNLRFIRKYDIHIIEEGLANYHQRPKVKNGINSNSIVGGKKKHLYYETYLKNKLLRQDFDEGKLGIGTIINLSKGYRNANIIKMFKEKLFS